MMPHFQGDVQRSPKSQGTRSSYIMPTQTFNLRLCLARSAVGCTSNPSSPYPVTGPTVAPAAFHLSKPSDAALLPAEAAARPVDEVHTRFWVYCEMEEEADHLPVRQNVRLRWTCRVNCKPSRQNSACEKKDSMTRCYWVVLLFLVTCSKLLNGHEGETDECERFAEDLALVLWRGLQLLPVSLGLCPAYCSTKQTHLPHAQSVSLQHCHQRVLGLRDMESKWWGLNRACDTVRKILAALPKSMSVKPSAARASPVFLSMFSRQRLASCGSSNNRAWIEEQTRHLQTHQY